MDEKISKGAVRDIQVQVPEDVQRGVYANQINISHSAEEFVFDYILLTPPTGVLNARTLISPANAKRLIAALTENVARYEAVYGEISLNPPIVQPAQLKTH